MQNANQAQGGQQPPVASTSSASAKELAAVSLSSRIADFWSDQPRLWFAQTEAVLAPQKLGDEQKYNIVVTKLGKQAIQQISDILLSPPETGKFTALKQRLLSVYEESEEERHKRLLTEMELGDQKPSQLIRRMLDLAGGKFPLSTIRMLWIGLMPPTVRAVLAASELTDLDKLAAIADKVMEASRATAGVAAVETSAPKSREEELLTEIAKINVRLDRMGQNSDERRRDTRQVRARTGARRPRARRTPEDPDWLCYYHYQFAHRANKCTKPCSWKAEN